MCRFSAQGMIRYPRTQKFSNWFSPCQYTAVSLPNPKVSPYPLSQSKSHDSSTYTSFTAISLFQTCLLMTHATTVRPRSRVMRVGGFYPRQRDNDIAVRCSLCTAHTYRLLQHNAFEQHSQGGFSPACSIHLLFYTCVHVIAFVAFIKRVRKISKNRLTISFVMSARPPGSNNSGPTRRIFMKICI